MDSKINDYMNKYIDLRVFKTEKCNKINKKHDYKTCVYFHSFKDKRRKNIDYYKSICSFYDKKNNTEEICPKRNKCLYCHNNFELHFHPNNYKKKFCYDLENCQNKLFCPFAHSEIEIKIDLLHLYEFDISFFLFKFKSQFCPIPTQLKHDKFNCIYAHNFQDFKRPFSPYLKKNDCEYWKKKFFKEYDQLCKNGTKCKKIHGWKEHYYYPEIKNKKKLFESNINKIYKNYLKNFLLNNKNYNFDYIFTFSNKNLYNNKIN